MIRIGNFDVAKEIVELHFQLRKTQKLLERVINAPAGSVTAQDVASIEQEAIAYVQKKFPEMRIEIKSGAGVN